VCGGLLNTLVTTTKNKEKETKKVAKNTERWSRNLVD